MSFIFLEHEQHHQTNSSIMKRIPQQNFGEYEVALVNLSFYDTFFNINPNFGNDQITINNEVVEIRPGLYTFEQLSDYLEFVTGSSHVSLKPHSMYNRLVLQLKNGAEVFLSHGMAKFLGFDPGRYVDEETLGQHNPQISMGNDKLRLHLNIASNTLNSTTKLFEDTSQVIYGCEINTKPGTLVVKEPNTPFFIPCKSSTFDNIHVWLTNQDNEPLDFVEPKWGLTLALRLKKSAL